MRIAQVATVFTRVCQDSAGSIEQIVWLLTEELSRLGHDVTVFAAAGSETSGELVATLPGRYGRGGAPADWQVCEWINLCRAVAQSGRFDILHSHAYLWGLPLQPLSQAPMIHTLHVTPHEDMARLWALWPDAAVTAISDYQWSAFPWCEPLATIHHGVDPGQFTFRKEPDDYLCYLGRFTGGKGPELAIATARTLGIRLVLAGGSNRYFKERIEPLVDGGVVEHVGWVGGGERDRLLGGARALLYPVREPEPFGLVMIEAMMCGTPVAAMRLGAVPEVVDDGVTGFTAEDTAGFAEAAVRAMSLDRRAVRDRAVARFSAARMAREYAAVYARVIESR
jgi:glycosyltransferase involved in cell wall biosynthesis